MNKSETSQRPKLRIKWSPVLPLFEAIRTTVNNTAIWILVSAAIAVLSISVFNRLVRARDQRRNAWATVEVNLKKRHDLIPNLVETVRGYTEHEPEVLERVIEKRREELNLNTESGRSNRARAHPRGGVIPR